MKNSFLTLAAPPAAPVADLEVGSVADFVIKGGPVMIPIILASLVALAIFIERLVALRRSRIIPSGLLAGLTGVFRSPRTDRAAAVAFCERDGSPTARVLAVGLKRLGEPVELLERHIAEAGEREVVQLRARLRVLAVVASVAPLLGLLGTIFGMISAFQTVATSADALGKTELLAEGIYEAMITTAAGLIVAIPALLAYHWLTSLIDRRVAEIDRTVAEFVEQYALGSPTGGRSAAETDPAELPSPDAVAA